MLEKIGLTSEQSLELLSVQKELHETGKFSGTDTCKCNGKVEYNGARSDGAKLGACKKCRALYIDRRK